MELKLENGRYAANDRGTPATVSGTQELLQRVQMRLQARRGGFPLMPDFGSRLHLLSRTAPSQRQAAAEQYAAEALAEETDLSVEKVTVTENKDTLALHLTLRRQDGSLLETTIDGVTL